MKDFRDLKIWQRSHQLALKIYKTTRTYPKQEIYGLISQTRRAAISLPANICEGCGRGTDIDMARFFQIAMGSASELEYHLILAKDLELIKSSEFDNLSKDLIEVKKMLATFIKKLRADH